MVVTILTTVIGDPYFGSLTHDQNIDPDTLWDAKIYAAQTKQTMGEVVTEALQRLVQESGD